MTRESPDRRSHDTEPPSVLSLTWRFGWPLLLLIGCTMLMVLAPDYALHLLYASGAIAVIAFVNVFVQAILLYRPQREDTHRRLLSDRITVAIVVTIVLLVLSPFLMFGACVLALDDLL